MYRDTTIDKEPHYLNYGFTRTGQPSSFKKMKSGKKILQNFSIGNKYICSRLNMILKYFSGKFFAAMSIAIILVLSGVALGVVFGLQSKAGQVVRYLVIGGNEIKTEVVEFMNSGSPPSYGSLPTVRYGAVGAMFGKIPILCGGNDGEGYDFDSCISQWSPSYSMNEKRRDAAGVKINSTMF